MLEEIPLYRALVKYFSTDEITRAYEFMQVVGIEHLAMQRSDTLSRGQRQRITIAHARAQRLEKDISVYVKAMVETLEMAVVALFLSILIDFPLSLFASRNIPDPAVP